MQTTTKCEHHHSKLSKVDSPANGVDWDYGYSRQSYQVYRCEDCQHIIGIRWQFDGGTGSDDHVHDFGIVDPASVKRHY